MEQRYRPSGGFRFLLVLGSAVSVAIGVWGIVWTRLLDSIIGISATGAASGPARLYGGVMIAIGVGYALGAAQPERNRSLLVPLFIVPLVSGLVVVAGAARGEIEGLRGALFATYNLVYCLFYFRLYPRVVRSEAGEGSGELPSEFEGGSRT